MTDDIYERTTQGATPQAHREVPASDSGFTAGAAQTASDAAGPTASSAGTPPPGTFADVPGPNAGVPPPGYTSYRGYAGAPVAAPPPGGPVPALAALLGLIPGVGAMYNGQFAKGLAHLAIFAVLVSLADHVNGIFGLFVAGWVFYQAFEAYHTARARRDGLPLPNAFGLNDIGERLGLGKNWPNQSATGTTGPARPSSVPPPATPPAW